MRTSILRVDKNTRLADTNECLSIPLNGALAISDKKQKSNMSADSSFNTVQTTADGCHLKCKLKLYAVSDNKQKLIGVVDLDVDLPTTSDFVGLDNAVINFQRCIDSKATLKVSTRMEETKSKTNTNTNTSLTRSNRRAEN